MAYKLVLTGDDRDSFDWVGDRYAHGNDMASVLISCLHLTDTWYEPGDMIFDIPESKAKEMRRLHEINCEGHHRDWPGFGTGLREKMQRFVDSII